MLALARAFLERKGFEEARLESELLVAQALELDRLGLFMQLERPPSDQEIDRARDFLVRRGKREPVAYIIGRREFYGRDFEVGAGVLIPRPETELIVDVARERCAKEAGRTAPALADLGCGSGCLAVTLALEIEGSTVFASDLSETAVTYTQGNAERLGARVEVMQGDGPEALRAYGPFDVLVSNPPYVVRGKGASLAAEVREFEPELALYAPDGDRDHWVRRLIDAVPGLLLPGGFLLVELSHDQADRALEICRRADLDGQLHEDLARIPRVLEVRRGS